MKYRPPKFNIAMLSIHSSPIGDLGTRDTGGMSVYIRELAKDLGRRGHSIDIFTQNDHDKHDPIMDLYDNVRLIHLSGQTNNKITKSSLYDYLPQIFQDLEAFRTKEKIAYDIIHSHYWLSGVLGSKARSSWNACHVLTYHTIGAVKKLACPVENESDLRLEEEKRLADLCDHIVVPSQNEKDFLIQVYDAPENKIQIVPCGVNLNRFKPLDKKIARKRLGLGMQDSIVLYVGRHTPIKGLDRLLKAFALLTGLFRKRLIMVGGDGEQSAVFQDLQSRAKALKLQDCLNFAGRIDQEKLPIYYSAADVLVVPSYYESFGLVALEALACGTPVVTTPVGAAEMIVKDGVTGYVADDSNPQHLARLIEAVLLRQQQNDLSPAKIRASVAEFSWARSASQMLEAYRTLLTDEK